ncbi:MAG: response regulator [Planctomycetota bacterium]
MATILVVDDRATNRDFLVTLLRYKNHELLEAEDGLEALELARQRPPDLIFTDVLMPRMDGYEFVRQLRMHAATANTPVVFFTAHYLEREAKYLAETCGVTEILCKPCTPETVLEAVERVLHAPGVPPLATTEEEFDRHHVRILTDKVSQKADELRVINARFSAMIDLGLQLGSERDPKRLLQSFCNSARGILGARFVILAVTLGDGSIEARTFSSGCETLLTHPSGSMTMRGRLAEICGSRNILRLDQGSIDVPSLGLPDGVGDIHSLLAVPVTSLAHNYGWACFGNKIGSEPFSEEEARTAGILAAQLGRIYENGKLYAEVQRQVTLLEREMEEKVRAQTERDRFFLQSLNLLCIAGFDGYFHVVNPAWERMLGYSTEELYSRPFVEFAHPEDVNRMREEVARLAEGESTNSFEIRVLCRDGSSRWILWNATPFLEEKRFYATGHDITEKKQAEEALRLTEEQFRQAQKMEAVGRLAGGVAHDFNNLMTVVLGYGDLVLASLHQGDPLRGFVAEIHKAGERATAVTRQLLAFSRKQILSPQVANVNDSLGELEKMLARLIGEDIKLRTILAADLGKVRVDIGQFEQVIVNLAINARDAMPDGGKLTIETKNVIIDHAYARSHLDVKTGPYVMIAVTDNGIGMSPEVRMRIFEPFFTTKPAGKGTGLGLATAYGTVKQSGGHIWVYSEEGTGTTFKIYLPRVFAEVEREEIAPAAEPMPISSDTILVVEDEPAVRELASHILELSGYTVLQAESAEVALEIVASYQGIIHLLLSDVIMPSMSGKQLSERLKAERPEMRHLFMSGYTDNTIVHHGVLEAGMNFLQKPFTAKSLVETVRKVLGE